MTDTPSSLLDWSATQGRILTNNGKANKYFTKENGFAFEDKQLPHHHLEISDCEETFLSWYQQMDEVKINDRNSSNLNKSKGKIKYRYKCISATANDAGIVGAWKRPLFAGCGFFENTSEFTENVFNLQTKGLFIDLRIPVQQPKHFKSYKNIESLTNLELRYLSRQHVFCGFSKVNTASNARRYVATRHHIMDWNYIGIPRGRPNKWYIEHDPRPTHKDRSWLETSYAKDNTGQSYYLERWERLDHDEGGKGRILSLLSNPNISPGGEGRGSQVKIMIIVIGNRFNFVIQNGNRRELCMKKSLPSNITSFTAAVDYFVEQGDVIQAREMLTNIVAGTGFVSVAGAPFSWTITNCVHPWLEGTRLFDKTTSNTMLYLCDVSDLSSDGNNNNKNKNDNNKRGLDDDLRENMPYRLHVRCNLLGNQTDLQFLDCNEDLVTLQQIFCSRILSKL